MKKINFPKTALLLSFALVGSTACGVQDSNSSFISIGEEGGQLSAPLTGVSDMELHGTLGEMDAVSGEADRVGGIEHLIEVSTIRDSGVAMLYVDLMETGGLPVSGDEVREETFAKGEEALEQVRAGEIEVVDGEIYVNECSGPTEDNIDFDAEYENSIVTVGEDLEEEGMVRVDVEAWNDGDAEHTIASFKYDPAVTFPVN